VSLITEGTFQETGTAVDLAGNIATATTTVNISFNYFKIRSWQTNPPGDPSQTGKCLDYGTSPIDNGATVFLNDCANAHPVRVLELNRNIGGSKSYEVMLFAGKVVIGIGSRPINLLAGAAAPSASTATEYSLELQIPWNTPIGSLVSNPANQIFRFDGDSIILEGTHSDAMGNTVPGPCINTSTSTTLCPAPPPQFVLQVENARGANGSPIVAGLRNLSDNEFWDFVAEEGSGKYPTSGFFPVAANYDLWNALCLTPTVNQALGVPSVGPSTNLMLAFNSYFGAGLYNGCVATNPNAGWGSVVVVTSSDPYECVDPEWNGGSPPNIGACIDLSYYPPLLLPSGVTIRGNRRGTNFGPQLYLNDFAPGNRPYGDCQDCVMNVQGDYARVTGLRLRGQSRATTTDEPGTEGVYISSLPSQGSLTEFISTVDHNDMSDWGNQAVDTSNAYTQNNNNCTGIANDPATLANATIARNFLHHNERDNDGYGVLAGRAFIVGNTFLMNRHDIAGGGEGHNEYRAWYNLKLSTVPRYPLFEGVFNQDFDMHGTCCTHSGAYGGVGGWGVDIAGNTFLGNNDYQIAGITVSSNWNFELRGYPCYADYFRDNVTERSQNSGGGNVINFHHVSPGTTSFFLGPDGPATPVDVAPSPATLLGNPATLPPGPVFDYSNQFGNSSPPFTNPTDQIGVGDFDGDGIQDTFLATGTAWYFSPGGQAAWRFLSARTDRIGSLLFGDFDGDGRTDVVAINPSGQIVVSWGGVSPFEVLNANPCTSGVPVTCPTSVADLAVGDFDGDGVSDLFFADGGTWWVSYGGNTPFVQVIVASPFRVSDLRFGDFNGDGATDVFGVYNGQWSVRYSARGVRGLVYPWTALPVSLTNSIDGLSVADFDGDGFADIGMWCGSGGFLGIGAYGGWQISYRGTQGWSACNKFSSSLSLVGSGIGRFNGGAGADVLVWNGNEFWVIPGGTGTPASLSTQDMR
jgi:hypothetical protein